MKRLTTLAVLPAVLAFALVGCSENDPFACDTSADCEEGWCLAGYCSISSVTPEGVPGVGTSAPQTSSGGSSGGSPTGVCDLKVEPSIIVASAGAEVEFTITNTGTLNSGLSFGGADAIRYTGACGPSTPNPFVAGEQYVLCRRLADGAPRIPLVYTATLGGQCSVSFSISVQ